ncbi:UDP-N-acetylmuramoyl-L-alanine--D-glutamate ligase [Clostridium intestinale]|uniref:UDP-N-acetylmuramoylalanine--D-glutamate ligase n=1 Tax=Clostridium intestinale DSM 6191 TaxID=1121320 RepID=A0A1M5ZDX4_9CLOT|nr:UDP-N-acetylmuramoyl-L-alanine--D-glutamate ligase [Clostridium intestinale]SHI22455.1 UDP-N-acetylmuramoylalanine--D-glutamate ligase [Clostridium intestinale DSM 6191]
MKSDFNEFKVFIKGKKVGVLGIGVSNIPLINFLLELGAEVTAFDKKDETQLGDIGKDFINKGVKLSLGEDYLSRLKGFDVIFKTPGMRIDLPELVNAKNEGAHITSEMEEFVKYCPAKIYGITGSDGKTTTTTIVSKLLIEEGFKTWVGGNIGSPLFSNIEEITTKDRVVLELSSFQLMTMKEKIDKVIVTNITPNHLDMHKGMDEYVDAKKNIFKYQEKEDLLVLNIDNEITKSFISEAKGHVKTFSSKEELKDGAYLRDGYLYIRDKKIINKDEIVIKGTHNIENYLAAFLVTEDEVSIESMINVARNFKGVAHRCELIREVEGVKYYNDSIASSPTRTLAGLKAFDEKVILIAGGYDKHIPFEPLAQEGHEYIKELILLGATKYKIKEVFDKIKEDKGIDIPVNIVESLEEAVKKAKDIAKDGDIVTLSPACASFDMFTNFEIRGNKFRDIVNSI